MSVLANLLASWEFIAAILVILLIARTIRWLTDPLRTIPGPQGYPIIGNTLDYSLSNDMHQILLQRANKYGKIYQDYSVFVGRSLYINDPEYARQILVTNSSSYDRDKTIIEFLPALGTGLLTTYGKAHAVQRKQLNPAFSLGSVKHFISVFNDKGNEFIKFWKDKIKANEGKPIECQMMHKFTDLTLDVIGNCAFGYEFNSIMGGDSAESKATTTILAGNFNILRRSFETLMPFLKLIPSKEREEVKKAEEIFHGLIETVIASRRREMEQNPGQTLEKTDLLQKLIRMYEEAGTSISNKDLFHQVFTFMLAGHETTSLTFTWAIFLLAKHPEIQDRARKEVRDVMGNSTEAYFEDLDRLKFLDDCIKESMRLYPVAIFTGRESTKPDKIGPYYIPAKTQVMVSIAALNRNEKHWKNPNEFNPDRFSTQVDKDPLFPYYFTPFSRGPRMCIGHRFAMMELKVIMAQLLNAFLFKLGKNQPRDISGKNTLTFRPNPAPFIEISKA